MKKNDIILIVCVLLVIVIAMFVKGGSNEKKVEGPLTLIGTPGTSEITYSDYAAKVSNNESFVVVLVQTGCSHCQNFEPIVDETATELQIPVYYLNLTNMSSDDQQSLSSSNSYLKKNEWGTPTTLVMSGDTVIDTIAGETRKENLVKFFKKNITLGEE